MKHIILVMAVTVFIGTFSGCTNGGKNGAAPKETLGKDASYALGMNIGTSMKNDTLYPDIGAFLKGMKDVFSDSELRFTMDEAYQIFDEAYRSMKEKRETAQKQGEIDFLAENSGKPGISVTDSGLQYEVISEGGGPRPVPGDTVRVHYEGALIDGTVFDSSYSRDEPAQFNLDQVIRGWTEGLQLMSVGSKYRLFIPSELGYGTQGAGAQIPPYSVLVFEVELLDILRME